jgi:hypothetical protein
MNYLTRTALVFAAVTVLGCGSDDNKCGTQAKPGILNVEDRIPKVGASVVNSNILHSFTVKDSPIESQDIYLNLALLSPKHTAGGSTPGTLTWTVEESGKDITWSTTINAWQTAPGHVEIVSGGGGWESAGCYYDWPSPLFSYDVR